MVEHAVVCGKVLFIDDAHHDRRECRVDIVGILVAQTDGQRSLGVRVDQSDLFACLGQPDPEICGHGRLGAPALLVRHCDNCCHFLPPCLFCGFRVCLFPCFEAMLSVLSGNVIERSITEGVCLFCFMRWIR